MKHPPSRAGSNGAQGTEPRSEPRSESAQRAKQQSRDALDNVGAVQARPVDDTPARPGRVPSKTPRNGDSRMR